MPPQLLETDEEEQAAIRDALLESLRLEEKARIRETLAPFTSRFDVPPEFTPEQRAEKAAATRTRLIEERAQSFTRKDVVDFTLLNPKLGAELGFSGTKKLLAERLLFPKEEEAPGFTAGVDLAEKEEEAVLAGVTGFALEKTGEVSPTSEALLNRSAILFEEVERQLAVDEGFGMVELGRLVGTLGVFALETVGVGPLGAVAKILAKKKIKKVAVKYALKRKFSKTATKKLVKRAVATPKGMADFAAVLALDTGLRTFASTGDLSETAKGAVVAAAIGGTAGALLASIPVLATIYKEARTAAVPRQALGLPKTGPLSREQLRDAAIATIDRQKTQGASIPELLQTIKNAEAIAEREGIAAQRPSVVSGRPGAPKAPRPTKAPKPKERQRERTQERREAPQEPEFFPEATEARLRPPKAARPPQEKVAPGAAPPVKGKPARSPLLRPARRTPEDPSLAPNVKGFRVSAESLEKQAAKPPAQQIAETSSHWFGLPRGLARTINPARLPIWAQVKGLRPVRKARVFFKRQQFVRFKEVETIFDAKVPIARSLLGKLTGKLEKAKPLRGRMEGLKAKERRRRSRIMAFIQEKVRGEKGAMQAAAQLRGAYPSVGFEPIGRFFNQAERNRFFDHINTHRSLDGRSFAKARLTLVMRAILEDGHLPTRGELAELELIFGPRFIKALVKKGEFWKRLGPVVIEALGVPRVLNTIYDLSATLRQGFVMVVTHPVISFHAFRSQLRAFGSERYALAVDRSLRIGPAARLREEAGLELTAITGQFSRLGEREEIFMSNIVQKLGRLRLKGPGKVLLPVKIFGMGARASERAFITYLNTIRANVFDLWAAQMKQAGHVPTNPNSFGNYQSLARLINTSTGRGNAKFLQGTVWNTIFFSPRFMTSRFEHIPRAVWTGLGPSGAPWALRQLALRQLVGISATWFGMATLINTAAEAFGWDIEMELDPRSSDFFKIRFGKTRIDMGVGYGQVIRLVTQLALDESVDPLTQKVSKISIGSKIGTFVRYKLAPVPGAVFSFLDGKTPSRDPATLGFLFEQLAFPIVAQNLREIVNEHGAIGLTLMVPEVLGVGLAVQDRDLDTPRVQNIAFQVTAIRAVRKDALNLIKGVLSRGSTPAELRAALRAEAVEQATRRARRREKPAATAASVRRAVTRALKSDSFKDRQKRLESLLRAAQ